MRLHHFLNETQRFSTFKRENGRENGNEREREITEPCAYESRRLCVRKHDRERVLEYVFV